MRTPARSVVLVLTACLTAAAADDRRGRLSVPGKLEVLAASDEPAAAGGPVWTSVRCELCRAGTYAFHFGTTGVGQPEVLTVAFPPPSPRFASVRPGGIHGGPPRSITHPNGPTMTRDASDPAVVTLRWTGDGPAGVRLERCEFTGLGTTQPATAPIGG